MERRAFLNISGLALGTMLLPAFGRAIAAEELLKPADVKYKKMLADTAMTAATGAGASYCDVRIGRYLNQFLTTRDLNIENITNTESAGVGVRVIANGAYGFAATSDMSPDGVAGAARQAVMIAKANSRLQTEPVRLAPVKGVGEVAWATPIKNFRFNESPVTMLNNIDEIGKPEILSGDESQFQLLIPAMKVRDFNFTSLSDAV